ncbi:MAG: hypothetical protein GW761_11925 [Leptospira sp.]|nr:hypothetical protein [Leptospira sp.]
MENNTFAIESRIQLYSALAEASEIEHNLMCLYLYTMFSLKKSKEEGLSDKELEAVNRWKKIILGVALEEMNHLTLVSNLLSSIGGSPNFMRPNFPTSPGPYPAGLVIELAPFNMSTIEHFIFLERPKDQDIHDGVEFLQKHNYTRLSEKGKLMPTSGDYDTVGALYESIREAFLELSDKLGEDTLFCGSYDLQIGPLDSTLPGLTLVKSKEDALKAIDTIITQGEGATNLKDSHFQRFLGIKKEYLELLEANPNFEPSRPSARNPVMRKPLNPENRVWIREPLAARYMDLANTLYVLMLRVLVQIYSIDERSPISKKILIDSSYTLMHGMASIAEALTFLKSSEEHPEILSGMSFAMVRSLAPLERNSEKKILMERINEILENMQELEIGLTESKFQASAADFTLDSLIKTRNDLQKMHTEITKMPDLQITTKASIVVIEDNSEKVESTKAKPTNTEDINIEISETDAIRLEFEAKKCIHSRHCVTELPNVFKANTPGKWIFAENTDPNILSMVARECPSGAIRFNRKDGGTQEPKPDVNIMRIRENGPYAFLAELNIDNKNQGYRATLCRCGQSKNKPFCDGAHVDAKFAASGEPLTIKADSLDNRDGKLKINRLNDGPLHVQGNVEICAGTGRIVLRTDEVKLCRCGNSKNKPICDGSHIGAGFIDKVE